jgi:hypothetical protein
VALDWLGPTVAIVAAIVFLILGVVVPRTVQGLRRGGNSSQPGWVAPATFLVTFIFSLVVLVAALVVMFLPTCPSGASSPSVCVIDDTRKWATGAIGLVLGYWFKTAGVGG